MYLKYLSSLEFFTYTAFLAIVVGAVSYVLPGRKPPLRTEPYSEAELGAHDGTPRVAGSLGARVPVADERPRGTRSLFRRA